jgi:hypothetical protein
VDRIPEAIKPQGALASRPGSGPVALYPVGARTCQPEVVEETAVKETVVRETVVRETVVRETIEWIYSRSSWSMA